MRVKLPLRLYKALLALMTCAGTISAFTLQTGNAQGWAPADIEYTKDVTAAGSSGGWGTADMTGDHLLNQNTSITFTTNGNVGTPFNCPGLHIKLSTQALGAQMNVNADMTASSVWFAGGRYLSNGANRYTNVGKVYVVGGQLWLDTTAVTIADITLGASTYTEGNVFNQASLRISGNSTFTKATIVEDTKIAFDASKTLTINELVGTNQITFDNFAGTNYVRLNSGYEGNLSVTGVTLNLGTNNTNYKSILLGAGSTLQVLTDVTSNLDSISSTEANSRILLQGATSVLNLTGTENQTHAGTLSGTGAINKNGAGILTLSGNLSAFTGDFNLNEGTLELTGTAMNGKLVIKQNNVNIKGNSSSFKHIEIASDVTLNASTHMPDGLTLTSGSLTLNANSIFVGDLTLNSSSLIIKGASDSMPTVTGSITCTGSELDLRSLANISSGDAVLNVSQTVTGADSFSVLLQNGSPAYASFENNKLVVYIRDSVNTLNWGGSGSNWNQDNAWVKDGTSQAISFQQGDRVQFGIDYTNAQTITIDKTQVLSGLSITGTADHTFNGTGSFSLRSNTIHISSTGTTNINLSNTTLEDNIVKLENGTLNLGAANALGSGTLNATNATINANSSGALNNIAINLDHSILTATNEQGTSLGEANKAGQITATNGSTINLAATDAVTNAITLSGYSNLNAQNATSNRINGALTFLDSATIGIANQLTLSVLNFKDTLTIKEGGNLSIQGNITSTASDKLIFEGGIDSGAKKTLTLNGNNAGTVNGLQAAIELGTHSILNIDGLNTAITLSGGAITLKDDAWIFVYSSNSGATRQVNKNIILDTSEDVYSGLGGATFGNYVTYESQISGRGNLGIQNVGGGTNSLTLRNGWINNSYEGKTRFDYAGSVTYTANYSVASGSTITPFGQLNEELGHGIASIVNIGTLSINAGNTTGKGITIANGFNISKNGANVSLTGLGQTATIAGSVTINEGGALNLINGNNAAGTTINLAGALKGSGNLTATNSNTEATSYLKLSGNTAAYTGTLTVGAGMQGLVMNSNSTFGGNIAAAGKVLKLTNATTIAGTTSFGNLHIQSSDLSNTSALLTTQGAATIGENMGLVTIDFNSSNLSNSSILWNYAGGIASGNLNTTNISSTGTYSNLFNVTIANDAANSRYMLTTTLKDTVLKWNGGTTTNNKWNTADSNWLNNAEASSVYSPDKIALFINEAGAQNSVIISEALANSQIFFDNAGTFIFSNEGTGALTGNVQMVKGNTGTVEFTSANANMAGTVALNAGSIKLSSDNALGTAALKFNGGVLELGQNNVLINNTVESGTLLLGVAKDSDFAWNNANAINLKSAITWGKTGEGTLTINNGNDTAWSNTQLNVEQGTLNITGTTAQTFANTMRVDISQGAQMQVNNGAANITFNSILTGQGSLKLSSTGTISVGCAAGSGNQVDIDILGGNLQITSGSFQKSTINLFANTVHTVIYSLWEFNMTTNKVTEGGMATLNLFNADRTLSQNFDIAANTTLKVYSSQGIRHGIFAGQLSGEGTLLLTGTGNKDWGGGNYTNYTINHANESFTGTINIASSAAGGANEAHVRLIVNNEHSISNASSIKFGNWYAYNDPGASGELLLNADRVLINGQIFGDGHIAAQGNKNRILAINSDTDWTLDAHIGNNAYNKDLVEIAETSSISFEKLGSGTLTMNGNNTYSGTTTVKAGALNFTKAFTFHDIYMAKSTQISSSAAINIAGGSTITLNLSDISTATGMISTSGAFAVTGTGKIELNLSGYDDSWSSGDYVLISAASGLDLNMFDWVNAIDKIGANDVSLVVSGNKLIFRLLDAVDYLYWSGTTNIWSGNSSGSWVNEAGTGCNSANGNTIKLTDSGLANATITIQGTVTPASMSVENTTGEYVFNADTNVADSKIESSSLTKSGAGTLTINNSGNTFESVAMKDGVMNLNGQQSIIANAMNITGGIVNLTVSNAIDAAQINLSNGVLTIGDADNAITSTNKLNFKGGKFEYLGTSVQDISNLIGAGSNSAANIKTSGNQVIWAPDSMTILGRIGLAKSGAGDWTINSASTDAANYQGGISISEGSLTLNLAHTATWAGASTVSEGSTLNLKESTILSGSLSGSGTINIEKSLVAQSANNFTGTYNLSNNASLSGKGSMGGNIVFTNETASVSFQSTNAGETVSFTGKLTGGNNNTLTANHSTTNILTGNLTDFTGTLTQTNANDRVIWKLQNATGIDQINLSGATFEIANNAALTLTNTISDRDDKKGNLIQSNTGLLTLTANNTATGTLTIGASGVQLGNGGATGSWAGTLAGTGALNINRTGSVHFLGDSSAFSGAVSIGGGAQVDIATGTSLGSGAITLNNGSLDLANQAAANKIIVNNGNLANAGNLSGKVDVMANAGVNTINLGNVKGSQIDTIKTSTDTTISGITGNVSLGAGKLQIMAGTQHANIGDATGAQGIVQFTDTTNTLTVENMTLNMSSALLEGMKNADDQAVDILITNGTLQGITLVDNKATNITFNPLLEAIGFAVVGVEGGTLSITGNADLIYNVVEGAPKSISNNLELNPYKIINVNDLFTINATASTDLADGVTISNLTDDGKGTGNIVINNTTGSGNVMINLHTFLADATYTGSITGADADIYKTGEFTQTITGDINVNSINLNDGNLSLGGKVNVDTLNIDGNIKDNTLNILNQSITSVNDLKGTSGTLNIATGGTLQVNGASSGLTDTAITGQGQIIIANGASIELTGTSTIDGVNAEIQGNGALNLADGPTNSLAGLESTSEEAVLDLGNGATVNIGDDKLHTYSGTLNGSGTINIVGKGTQFLTGKGSSTVNHSVTEGNLGISNGGIYQTNDLTLNHGNLELTPGVGSAGIGNNTQIQVGGNLNFSNNSSLHVQLNTSNQDWSSQPSFTVDGTINITDTTITLSSLSSSLEGVNLVSLNLVLIAGGDIGNIENVTVVGGSLFDTFFHGFELITSGNNVIITAQGRSENPFGDAITSNNSATGSELLWEGRKQASFETNSHLTNLLNFVSDKTNSSAERSDALASAVGPALTTLSAAQMGNLKTHTQGIRNRALQSGLNVEVINEDLPYLNMWVEATGGYQKLDQSGHEAGYGLSTWGANVGADINVSEKLTLGLAFGTNFGKLDAKSVDNASGNLDSYYLSLFAHHRNREWTNTFIVTGALNHAKLDRTVSFGDHQYRTHSSTNGGGFSAMYELTYDYALNEEKTSILQPLFNASVYSTNMKGFTEEEAGDASLHVDDQKYTVVSLALGGRWIKKFESGLFGRESFFDFRANISQDFGDDRAKANVAFDHASNLKGRIEGSKIGMTALQFGAGLNIPVGEQSNFFINANADFRSKASGVDGQIGYRYSF